MDFKHRFQRWFKFRFAILYPFAIYLIFFANSDDSSLIRGSCFIAAGLMVRLWANCYAIKMERLTTSGPYAHIRHPLYFGTVLIMLGFIVMLKVYWIGALFLAFFLTVYVRTIQKEEAMLVAKFGDAYVNYRKAVPAIFPRLTAYAEGDKWPFSFERLLKSQEYKLFIWVIILVIAFHLKDELIIEREAPDLKIWALVITAFVLGCSDMILDMYRKKEHFFRVLNA